MWAAFGGKGGNYPSQERAIKKNMPNIFDFGFYRLPVYRCRSNSASSIKGKGTPGPLNVATWNFIFEAN